MLHAFDAVAASLPNLNPPKKLFVFLAYQSVVFSLFLAVFQNRLKQRTYSRFAKDNAIFVLGIYLQKALLFNPVQIFLIKRNPTTQKKHPHFVFIVTSNCIMNFHETDVQLLIHFQAENFQVPENGN